MIVEPKLNSEFSEHFLGNSSGQGPIFDMLAKCLTELFLAHVGDVVQDSAVVLGCGDGR